MVQLPSQNRVHVWALGEHGPPWIMPLLHTFAIFFSGSSAPVAGPIRHGVIAG